MPLVGRHIEIRGVVQGVGFRPWVYQLATREGVAGRVHNDSRGVVIDAFGTAEAIENFTLDLGKSMPVTARVREIDWQSIPYEPVTGFAIVASARAGERNISIPPDLATCPECLDEIFDPNDRRYLYPFTNCTHCGPRYTIVRDVPYDRGNTTMESFVMCAGCRREYHDPLDRRFHAQPNACPACGPKLTALRPNGREIVTHSPIRFVARALKAHLIVAVKGLGGFHLACDAMSSLAINRLRERKRREARPLAIMVRDLAQAEELADLTNAERALLASVERPIVLVRRRRSTLPDEIAPGSPLVGLFLPYTPLHHILLRECGIPLVMTSGNVSDNPMCTSNDDALDSLSEIADLFLMHDRNIETRADDSVTRVIAGAPMIMRRARGYVPRGVELKRAFAEPVLAVGAHLKNAICIGAGKQAFLGPHVGDLLTLETEVAFEQSIEQMKKFVGVDPKIIAHDLHPDYASTHWAEDRRSRLSGQAGLPVLHTIAIQHHHAHVVSAMAEHGLDGTAIGVAYDGTGYGTDGTSWGGEILIASFTGFERFATFRPIALAGGDQAIRQVWRIALALLDDAFDGTPPLHALPLFRMLERPAIESIRRMIANNVNTPRARGVGRYFDALGAIGLAMPVARFEGEIAMAWNNVADPLEHGRYEVVVRDGVTPWEIDPRPMIKSAVLELLRGVSLPTISARFHNTIAAATVEVVRAATATHGNLPIVLTGGCFQNALLAESVLKRLPRAYIIRSIPPGDGGIALGQAVIADALHREAGQPGNREAGREVTTCA
ncbi:MAG TPA: carbamoyltransferase HypF [Thermoanaerobaculia bacterium]|nr:carbamoyltransferase HypF [Thermoanaerobaculia bacterium]